MWRSCEHSVGRSHVTAQALGFEIWDFIGIWDLVTGIYLLAAFSFFGLLIATGCAAAVFDFAALSLFLRLCGRMDDWIRMARLSEKLRDGQIQFPPRGIDARDDDLAQIADADLFAGAL